MATTENVLTGLGTSRVVYREFASTIGVLVAARSHPQMIDRSLTGTKLGLHNEQWAAHIATQSGATTYYVRIEPIFGDMTDPDAVPLRGTPNTVNATKGVTFDFDPFPDDYPCTGYRVWAGTVAATLYLQGTLTGKFNTHFVIGTTWSLVTTGDTIDAQTVGVPAFVNCCEVYQAEGSIDARMFLGGGKKYSGGYAKVAQADSAPSLKCDTAGSATFGTWAAVNDGSFRMRIDNEWYEFTGIDFTGDASMANVATTLQTTLQDSLIPKLISGSSPNTTIADWAAISDGSLNVVINNIAYDVTSCDFTTGYSGTGGIVASMTEVAQEVTVQLQAAIAGASVRWDGTAGRFIVDAGSPSGSDLVTDGDMSNAASWTEESDWAIAGGVAACDATAGTGDFLWQDVSTDLRSKTWLLTFDVKSTSTDAATIAVKLGVNGPPNVLNLGVFGMVTSGWTTHTKQFTTGAAAAYDSIMFRRDAYGKAFELDNVTLTEVTNASPYLSYLARHSTAVGTDISGDGFMSCRGDSEGVVLNRRGKAADLDTVTWSTDHFVITRYPISVTSDPGASGTYVGGSGWMNGEAASVDGKTMTCGTIGETTWGNWAAISDGEFTMALGGKRYDITAVDFSGDASGANVAATLQVAIRAATGGSETVTYSTDHFVIALTTSGDEYRLSLLESATADVGTDISGSSWLNADSDSEAVYTPGKTDLRTVEGNGTDWGEWIEGMKFRALDQGKTFIVKEFRSTTELILDEDYTGDGFDGWTTYILEPYGAQLYVSALGNPFDFPTDNIVQLPTPDSDVVTAIKRSGANIAVMMEHTTWLVDSVDVTSPRMVSPYYGAPSTEACISWENGVAYFTGEEFVFLKGGRVVSLDPEGRTRGLISRVSTKTPFPHGVFLPDPGILMWCVGLDGSGVYNMAICYYPKTGAWWLYNHKNASASLVIWDDSGKPHLMTGSTYDDQHAIPAFTFLHDDDYKADGASTVPTVDRQGTINAIGTSTTTAGYLTCATAGTATFGDYASVADGYFRVTIDGSTLDVGPVDFGSVTDMDDVATAVQTAVRAATGAGGAELVTWSTDHFVITSGTNTNLSNVSNLIPYFPNTTTTDLSNFAYLNGRSGYGTATKAVSTLVLTLDNFDGNAANLERTGDGEKGIYLFVCDTNGENAAYGRVVSNTQSTVTITPAPSTTPVADWYWFMGGIVPTWLKWTDFGSPQHKQKTHGFTFTIDPNQSTSGNDRVFLHGLQDLRTTVRTKKNVTIGAATDDTVNVLKLMDKPATQHGFRFFRPSSVDGLRVQDFTMIHRAKV